MLKEHHRRNLEVYSKLSEHVIGHDNAKKVLINLVNRSQIRWAEKYAYAKNEDECIRLSNCLLIGESGTGKTHLVESLSKVMKFPLVTFDATTFMPTSAAGGISSKGFIKKIKDEAQRLVDDGDDIQYMDLESTLDQMIVFVDEIDKLANKTSNNWNAHVQDNFLRLFENKSELSGVTYVFAGAFSGMEKGKTTKAPVLGFNPPAKTKKEDEGLSERIIKFGLVPELVGRINNIVTLDVLTKEDYSKILVKSIIPRATRSLQYLGIDDFNLDKAVRDDLIEAAMASGLGIRSLETGVNRLLVDLEFNPTLYKKKGKTLCKS